MACAGPSEPSDRGTGMVETWRCVASQWCTYTWRAWRLLATDDNGGHFGHATKSAGNHLGSKPRRMGDALESGLGQGGLVRIDVKVLADMDLCALKSVHKYDV